MTHAQYEDEPAVTVDWMLAVDNAVSQAERQQQEQAARSERGVVTRPL